MTPEDLTLTLGDLANGMPGLSTRVGAAMAEAAAVCLDDCGHGVPVRLTVDGAVHRVYDLIWWAVGDQIKRTWADEPEATELGACGIAILVVRSTRGYEVVERSRKGTGFDYWLGDRTDMPFRRKSRLEVSGIRRGDIRRVEGRIQQKIRQISAYANPLPGIVVVVEFSAPLARMMDQ